jgi:uncharacterized protein (TIGR02246 family)
MHGLRKGDAMDTSSGAERRRREWIAAVESGDIDAYAEIVAADVVWIPPSGAPITGREGFREWLSPFMAEYDYGMSFNPSESVEVGDWAWETGRFVSRMRAKAGGAPMEHGGRYFVLWRAEADGKWRIDRYVDGVGGAEVRETRSG